MSWGPRVETKHNGCCCFQKENIFTDLFSVSAILEIHYGDCANHKSSRVHQHSIAIHEENNFDVFAFTAHIHWIIHPEDCVSLIVFVVSVFFLSWIQVFYEFKFLIFEWVYEFKSFTYSNRWTIIIISIHTLETRAKDVLQSSN